MSCNKDAESEINCDTQYYVPEEQLSWLPYFTSQGEALTNNYFILENDTFYLSPQELIFTNETQDSQIWKLVYLTDKFNAQIYQGCPLYQEIKFTFYNNDISRHLELGFVFRDTNYLSSADNTELYLPMINAGACTTEFENGQGVLGGTCYSTAFDIFNFSRNPKIEYLDVFITPSGTYESVFLIKINHAPQSADIYDFYLAKDHGLVAYRNQNVLWVLS